MRDQMLAERIERNWLDSELSFAKALARLDPSWGTVTFELADGAVVLGGPGLFVNRAFALGITASVTSDHLEELERRAVTVGVVPEVELTDLAEPSLVDLLVARGYQEAGSRSAVVMALNASHQNPTLDAPVTVEPVRSTSDSTGSGLGDSAVADSGVALWQETAAAGFEITNERVRRASDLFARTAYEVDDPGLMIARSTVDGRPLGCATLKVYDGIATLGGMSTLPAERGKGVQATLITHRLKQASERGCDYAVSSAETGSTSERNLIRHGFTVSHLKISYTLT